MTGRVVISILSLLFSTTRCSDNKCISHNLANPFIGRYCLIRGINTPNLAWHQCKQFCLQSSNCQAVNYNFTDNLCTYFTATCPKAISDPSMAFALFTGKRPEQYIEWIPIKDRHPLTDRSVTEGNKRFFYQVTEGRKWPRGLLAHSLDILHIARWPRDTPVPARSLPVSTNTGWLHHILCELLPWHPFATKFCDWWVHCWRFASLHRKNNVIQ